jgi:hypothetical protein
MPQEVSCLRAGCSVDGGEWPFAFLLVPIL